MKALLYVRVSTTKQVEQGASLETQEARLRQYAAYHGFEVVCVVADEGLSGKTTARPGFQKVMETVRLREVDVVIVYSLSRFARNTIATLEAIDLMNRRGVAFHSLSENIDTTSPIGRFFLTTLAALAQLERDQTAERTRAVLQHKKEIGERVGQLPFGYTEVGGKVVPYKPEQESIALIRSLRARGMTLRAIATELRKLNIVNKTGKPAWSPQMVHRIVRRVA